MTIYIFVLKGELNGKIVVVRFFFLLGIYFVSALQHLYNIFVKFVS